MVAADLRSDVELQGDDERGAAAERPGSADASETAPKVTTIATPDTNILVSAPDLQRFNFYLHYS